MTNFINKHLLLVIMFLFFSAITYTQTLFKIRYNVYQ